jgi:hypothetical protein
MDTIAIDEPILSVCFVAVYVPLLYFKAWNRPFDTARYRRPVCVQPGLGCFFCSSCAVFSGCLLSTTLHGL